MTSFKFIKTNIGLILFGLGLVSILAIAGFLLWSQLQGNVNLLENKIIELHKQVEDLPKKEKFVLEKLSLKKEIVSLEKDRITLQNNAYGTIVQAVGALSIIATAFFTWRNVRTAEKNLNLAEEKLDTDRYLAEEKLVTERYSKAIELLASEKLEMRLGGIYALERVAKDSEKDYWQVMEVLTAFIRQNKTIKSEEKPERKEFIIVGHKSVEAPDDYEEYDERDGYGDERDGYDYEDELHYYQYCTVPNEDYVHSIEVDIQAILTVLGRREEPKKNHQRQILDIQRTDLRGVILAGNFTNVNFSKVNLQYAVIIEKADFSESLGLSSEIKRAKNWEKGIYSPELKKKLGIDNT